MIAIKNVTAREILDSRGRPTIETTIELSDGSVGVAAVPSGKSIGRYEALELRDGDPNRFDGWGVLKAVSNVNDLIGPKIENFDTLKQGALDKLMINFDGTANKARLGANAILSVSLANARAAAEAVKRPLYSYISDMMGYTLPTTVDKMPTPTFNIINGGKHGTGNLDFQEYHVIPSTIKPYHEALQMGQEVYTKLREILIDRNASHAVGDEGGYTPNLYTNVDALEAIMEAIKGTKYKFGLEIYLGLDVAASNLLKDNNYYIKDRPTSMTTEDMIEYYENMHRDYHLLFLEDGLAEEDWQGWRMLTAKLGREVYTVGDDLLVTHPDMLNRAIREHACNSILVKPNQIGTLSETLSVIQIAKKADFKVIVSHRSGETNDSFIADLAVGVGADYVKFGAPARGERVAKYNRLLRIEEELKLK
jgi:enolase